MLVLNAMDVEIFRLTINILASIALLVGLLIIILIKFFRWLGFEIIRK